MNKERLQAIIKRIEADLDGWDQKFWDSANTPRLAFFAQIDAGLELHIFNARRDARIWLDLSNKQADYLLSNLRTVVEIKRFLKQSEGLKTNNQLVYLINLAKFAHRDER